jgi:guanylate kinase
MNKLAQIQKFQAALDDYHPSKAAIQILSQTELVLLVAPAASGRNTIIRELLKTDDYYFIVSDTTRKPRINDGILEQDGREYWFRSEPDMLTDIKSGKFLEAAIIHNQQVSGISIRELQKAQDLSKIALTDAEVAGADNAIRYKPDTVVIFVLPPNFEEWQRRLRYRGDMHNEEFKRRMESALMEFEVALNRDYFRFVINDAIDDAAAEVNQIVKLDIFDESKQASGRKLAEQLYIDTTVLLKSL